MQAEEEEAAARLIQLVMPRAAAALVDLSIKIHLPLIQVPIQLLSGLAVLALLGVPCLELKAPTLFSVQ